MSLISTALNAKEKKLKIVDGKGIYLELADGRRVIDASNTSNPLGHGHPALKEAVETAAAAPYVNEGWPWHERFDAATELIEIAFDGETDWIGGVRFALGGSDANDMALALAQAVTGRPRLVTRVGAYHGGSGLGRAVTAQPQWHGGITEADGAIRGVPQSTPLTLIASPPGPRLGAPRTETEEGSSRPGDSLPEDTAAVIIDYSQGGRYHSPDYQDTIADAARRCGALWIADEVVTGLGRTGRWFAFQGGKSRPDIVTLGKPLAGGAAPAGAVVLSKDVVSELGDGSWQNYGTFRGHPVSVAAVRAHLKSSTGLGLVERAKQLDQTMAELMGELLSNHPSVARVDGRGLHWTAELVEPSGSAGDPQFEPLASQVVNWALEEGVLLGTSAEPHSFFLAPPLVSTEEELGLIGERISTALAKADALVG